MRDNKLTQSFNVVRNLDRGAFQTGGNPSTFDIAKTVLSRAGSDAASAFKERYVDNPSNIPADAMQLAVSLAKRTAPIAATLDPSPLNSGEDEFARQMRMGLRSSLRGYGEEPVEPTSYARGGRLLQNELSDENLLDSGIIDKYFEDFSGILKFKQDAVVAKALEIIRHMMVNR